MKFLICTVVAAVTLLSLTTAAVLPLPHPDVMQKMLETRRSNEAVAQSEEYELYSTLAGLGWLAAYNANGGGYNLIYTLTNATEGFSSAVKDTIYNEVFAYGDATYAIFSDIFYGRNKDFPMSQIATEFFETIAQGKKQVTNSERKVKSLVEAENLKLWPLVQLIFAGTDVTMTASLAPAIAYLSLFHPSQ